MKQHSMEATTQPLPVYRYLTVLDYFTNRIWQYDQSYMEGYDHVEDFLVEQGFSLSNIEYMVSTNPSAVFNRKYNKNL